MVLKPLWNRYLTDLRLAPSVLGTWVLLRFHWSINLEAAFDLNMADKLARVDSRFRPSVAPDDRIR